MQTNSQQPYAAISPIKAEVLKENQFRTNDMPAGSALLVGNVAVSTVAGSFLYQPRRVHGIGQRHNS